jgi:dTDP-4-dehydrorhamnose 3,5-epimerase
VKVVETTLPGVLIVEPRVFRDGRGFFMETFNAERYAACGLPTEFRQDNHSRSTRGVLRGLHYQLHRPQGKLVSVVRGRVFDVAVDIRRGSPTFGRWFGTELSDEAPRAVWIPPGFAHGFCTLSEVADFVYKCTDVYVPEHDRGILWSDPSIGIDWPVGDPLLSDRDRALPLLSDAGSALPDFHR